MTALSPEFHLPQEHRLLAFARRLGALVTEPASPARLERRAALALAIRQQTLLDDTGLTPDMFPRTFVDTSEPMDLSEQSS